MIAFAIVAGLLTLAALSFVLPPLLGQLDRQGSAVDSASASAGFLREQMVELDAELGAGRISREDHRRARLELEWRVVQDSVRPMQRTHVDASDDDPPQVRAVQRGASGEPPSVAASVSKRGLVHSRRSALGIALALPAISISMYAWLGSPLAFDPRSVALAGSAQAGQHTPSEQQIRSMVARLEERLRSAPADADGWVMLARSRTVLGQYRASAQAYARAVEQRPRDVQLLVDYADVLAMANGKRLAGAPKALVERALREDPRHLKALGLAGSAAFEVGDYAQAVRYWETLVDSVAANLELRRSVQSSIAEARRRIRGEFAGSDPKGRPSASVAPGGARSFAGPDSAVTGEVALGPGLRDRVRPDDTVFVFAREVGGGRMPLAIVRRSARELPFEFRLDDAVSMSPTRPLSGAGEVVVVARVSRSGAATPQPGDFEGSSASVRIGASAVSVRIDSEVR